tara:strand:+ start:676 stop:945 length:270 start_codon:yes stop_codon:yes gene_type:complete
MHQTSNPKFINTSTARIPDASINQNISAKDKFQKLMLAGQDTQKQLEGLNNRYKQGLAKGNKYFEQQQKLKIRNKKLGLTSNNKRLVMF